MNASLNEKLRTVKWGEYKLGDLFESSNGDFDIQKEHINGKGHLVITSGMSNNGILGKTDVVAKVFKAGTITIDMFGTAFYRSFDYKMVTHARVFSLAPKNFIMNDRNGLFVSSALWYICKIFGFENMCSWEKIKGKSIKLPKTADGKIDFNFMESFIAELSAYLKVSGLDNYELSSEEKKAIELLKKQLIIFTEFEFCKVFNNIKQGRRLKKDDQISGNIPFVMSGTTNTGVVGYISNPVASFPKNSITIDIFGNSFYRNYDFGAGDDTGVYWSTENSYSKETMLFFTTSTAKALKGKYSYGEKLRSSQSLYFKMNLPTKDGKPDYETMDLLISAVQKLVIKDVVLYADRKIEKTKEVVNKGGK